MEINSEGIRVPIEYEIPPAPNSTATESDLEVKLTRQFLIFSMDDVFRRQGRFVHYEP